LEVPIRQCLCARAGGRSRREGARECFRKTFVATDCNGCVRLHRGWGASVTVRESVFGSQGWVSSRTLCHSLQRIVSFVATNHVRCVIRCNELCHSLQRTYVVSFVATNCSGCVRYILFIGIKYAVRLCLDVSDCQI